MSIDGEKIANNLNYNGMTKGVRKLAVLEKLASVEDIAIMSTREVCDLIAEKYEILYAKSEELALVKIEDYNKVNDLIVRIER